MYYGGMTMSDEVRRFASKWPGTQKELAAKAGVDPSLLSRFLRGRAINSGQLDKLTAALGLKLTKKGGR